ncbi:squamosa promoter-binding-like protein 4 [Tanacetum coccineum]
MSMTKKDLLNDRGNGEDDVGGGSSKWDVKKKKPGPNGSGSTSVVTRCCQAEKCTSNLAEAKQYHRRHRVCESHAKAQAVVVAVNFENGRERDSLKGSGVGTCSTQALHEVDYEVEPPQDHRFEEELLGSCDLSDNS